MEVKRPMIDARARVRALSNYHYSSEAHQDQEQQQQQQQPPSGHRAPKKKSNRTLNEPTAISTASQVPQPQLITPDLCSELRCSICMEVPLDPLLTPCNHLFCKPCLLQSVSRTPSCPNCSLSCNERQCKPLEPNTLLHRIWASIQVKCQNHDKTCVWKGAISDYPAHAAKCAKGLQDEIGELRKDAKKWEEKLEMVEKEFQEVKEANIIKGNQIMTLKFKIDRAKEEKVSLISTIEKMKSELLKGGSNGVKPFGGGNFSFGDRIFVHGAGLEYVNGIYYSYGTYDGVRKYRKKTQNNGRDYYFTLFRVPVESSAGCRKFEKRWYLCIAPHGGLYTEVVIKFDNNDAILAPGCKKDAIYYAEAQNTEGELPTQLEWSIATLTGRAPNPTSVCIENFLGE